MDLLTLAGFRAVRITQIVGARPATPSAGGQRPCSTTSPAPRSSTASRCSSSVAELGQRDDAADATRDQADFAAYAASIAQRLPVDPDLIVGNEPNLNRFWLPQFNADGSDAAAPAYESLLARTYDALKAVDPKVRCSAARSSPRGGDAPAPAAPPTRRPRSSTISAPPTAQAAGRRRSWTASRSIRTRTTRASPPVAGTHPNTTTIALADYDKLVTCSARRSTAPRSRVDAADLLRRVRRRVADPGGEAALYTGTEPATTKPVDEATQADVLPRRRSQLAFCQPNVRGLFLFHAVDETASTGWQSGLYYADDTPKPSLTVRVALPGRAREWSRSAQACPSPVQPTIDGARRECAQGRNATSTARTSASSYRAARPPLSTRGAASRGGRSR